jgi:hypothetical protein
MQFIALINCMARNTTMSTNWFILWSHLPRKLILLCGNIFGYQGCRVWIHGSYEDLSLAFFLNN